MRLVKNGANSHWVKGNMPKFLSFLLVLLISFVGCSTVEKHKDKESSTNSDSPFEVRKSVKKSKSPKPVTVIEKILPKEKDSTKELCYNELKKIPGKYKKEELEKVCEKVEVYDDCYSQENRPIFHYDRIGKNLKKGKRILTLSLIHGDERPSGSVSRSWMTRLDRLDPRNTWRVIPLVNPDGFKNNTRTNANKVDVNRNFPTEDWEKSALYLWRTKKKSDPRRFPGSTAASEPETKCLITQIERFKPDFIISIHTPLGVLDFDGPKKIQFPHFSPLPWISLGNFPGSLGRFMWVDRKVPVLTIELNGAQGVNKLQDFDKLQDISGTVAIQSGNIIKRQAKNKVKDK